MKNKKEFQFKAFNDIKETFSKNFQQIVGNKGAFNIEGVEKTRKNQLLFIEYTLLYMVKTMNNNEYESALAITGIEHAVGMIARGNNWTNKSDFADRLDEVVGKAQFNEKNQKISFKMSAVQEVECLTAAEKFLTVVLYKNRELKYGLKDEHLYSSCDCKGFNTTMVWDMVCLLIKSAKQQVQKESVLEQKKSNELENVTTKSNSYNPLQWFKSNKSSPVKINPSVDQFIEENHQEHLQEDEGISNNHEPQSGQHAFTNNSPNVFN